MPAPATHAENASRSASAVGGEGRASARLIRSRDGRARVGSLSEMDLSLFFAGTSASAPSARRGMPAILVRRGGDRILFDCGEGTQRQLTRSAGLADITDVFITHLHADHWLGLPGDRKSTRL